MFSKGPLAGRKVVRRVGIEVLLRLRTTRALEVLTHLLIHALTHSPLPLPPASPMITRQTFWGALDGTEYAKCRWVEKEDFGPGLAGQGKGKGKAGNPGGYGWAVVDVYKI